MWWCEEMWRKRERGTEAVQRRDLALLNQLVGLCVALQPSIIPAVMTIGSNNKKEQTAQREEKVKALVDMVEVVSKLFAGARECIRRFLFSETEDWTDVGERPGVETWAGFIRVECLLKGLPPTPSSQQARVNPRMQGHVTAIVKDMSNNWITSDGRVTTRITAAGGPARVPGQQQQQQRLSSSTQSTTGATPARSQGTGYTVRDREELLWDLYARLGEWRLGEGSDDKRGHRMERRRLWDDEMFMF